MTKIKICGITNKIDALNAVGLGVDMLGFVFYNKSKRYVDPKAALDIINELPPFVGKVGVFVDGHRDDVSAIAEDLQLDMLQFHGNEKADYCDKFRDGFKVIKAFRLRDRKDLRKVNDYDTDFFLFDTRRPDSIGGTGKVFDWEILRDYEFLRPVILSGGLTPDNVSRAIKEVAPYGVDVSTGVEERPGKKDKDLMKRFVEEARKLGL